VSSRPFSRLARQLPISQDAIFSSSILTRDLYSPGGPPNPQLLPAESPQYQFRSSGGVEDAAIQLGAMRDCFEATKKEN